LLRLRQQNPSLHREEERNGNVIFGKRIHGDYGTSSAAMGRFRILKAGAGRVPVMAAFVAPYNATDVYAWSL
jgi:hypothetical protein